MKTEQQIQEKINELKNIVAELEIQYNKATNPILDTNEEKYYRGQIIDINQNISLLNWVLENEKD